MPSKSASDIRSFKFLKAVLYEFLGTFMMVLLEVGASSYDPDDKSPRSSIQIPFAVGLSVATVIWGGDLTGGNHVNPSVSFAFLITHKIGILSFVFRSFSQTFGATAAAHVIKFVSPPGFNDHAGAVTLGDGVTWYQGFIIEAIITFLLIFVIMATADSTKPHPGGSAALSIGLCCTLNLLWAGPFTGGCMNPAAAIGTHIASGFIHHYPYLWIYLVGPLIGSLVASLLYHLVFAGDSSMDKFKKYLKDFFIELL